MSQMLWIDLIQATGETIYMVLISTLLAIILGWPLGTWLYTTTHLKPNFVLSRAIESVINIMRSIPFIILLVALIPVTRYLVGTSIGLHAAIVPLTLGAAPFFARLVDNSYKNLSPGLIEAGHAMGASHWQMMLYVLMPEARAGIIQAITVTAITLINYSAMAGTVGGGGLGDLAIRFGYQRFNMPIMLATVVILVVLVQIVQWSGDRLVRYCTHVSG